MEERYEVLLHSQLGPRQGTLTLRRTGEQARGTLTLMGHQNAVEGDCLPDGTVRLRHTIRTAVGEVACKTTLTLRDGTLSGDSEVFKYAKVRWSGKRSGNANEQA